MKFVTFSAGVMLGASLCLADSYTGKLVDADCLDRQSAGFPGQHGGCNPGRFTTRYAVATPDDRLVRFDSTGNARAAELMHDAAGGNPVNVTISGTPDGSVVRVDDIEVQP